MLPQWINWLSFSYIVTFLVHFVAVLIMHTYFNTVVYYFARPTALLRLISIDFTEDKLVCIDRSALNKHKAT